MTNIDMDGPSHERANSFPWPPVLLAAALIAACGMGQWHPLPWPGQDDTPARIIGVAIGAAGVGLIALAALALWRHETTIMPHGTSRNLVTSGPYRVFRNPIYLGEVMVMCGLAELSKNIWFVAMALAFALLVTWLQILPEEQHLEARFKEAYLDYKKQARRWI